MINNQSRLAFIKALEANQDDNSLRLVYADWLEENGEYEEAERQRKWKEAKEWIMNFCEIYGSDRSDMKDDWEGREDEEDEEDNNYYPVFTYRRLMKRAMKGAKDRDYYINCGANQTVCDALRDQGQEFWKNFGIVTGMKVPESESGYAGCAC